MKVLNLVNLGESDIKYKINEYPDGQRDIIITPFVITDHKIQITFGVLATIPSDKRVQIKSRLNNFEDLGIIICATQALRNEGIEDISLYVPYIVGLRSDRLFGKGGVRYIKDILAPILNAQKFKRITCLDAHSYVAENCIDNLEVITNEELVKFALGDIYDNDSNIGDEKGCLVSPDDGASKKIFSLARELELKNQIIICSKDRDKEGKLTKCVVPISATGIITSPKKDYIIIDDICDGGGTFINIAKEIKSLRNDVNIYLIVTHGIFSKGFVELSQYFDGIYCTNSYRDTDLGLASSVKNNEVLLKQLNVF